MSDSEQAAESRLAVLMRHITKLGCTVVCVSAIALMVADSPTVALLPKGSRVCLKVSGCGNT